MIYALAFKAYRIPSYDGRPWQLMAEGSTGRFDVGNVVTYTAVLDPQWGSAAAYYRVDLNNFKDDNLGWLVCNAGFSVDGVPLDYSRAVVPASIYIREQTDTATEILRFRERHALHEPKGHGPANAPFDLPSNQIGADWLLEIRRCA